jgi:dCTP deaminase
MEESTAIVNGVLTSKEINERLDKDLFIRPLLEADKQLGEVGIDFRLGYDFLVSIQGREAFINASSNTDIGITERNINQFFQRTRRQLGETFILHPNQMVLAASLEYVKLPNDVFMMLFVRSSYLRLGLSVSAIVQPGYCGCISLELTNTNKLPVNLTVGARIVQGLLFPTNTSTEYFAKSRKYICSVRPTPSAALKDSDLDILHKIWSKENNQGNSGDI